MIEFRRLFRYFDSLCAVEDLTFEVKPGEVFGYIGPNGAGKTTSMRILATLEIPSFGDALINGFSVVSDPDQVRKRIGFMPDNFGSYRNMDCQEYLDFFARAYGLVGRERHQAIQRVMSFTGLDKLADKGTRSLSKGMKQRLALGRSLIHNPDVLIMDEPAAGLDPRARIELRDMIGALAADGKTILISSHILTELAEMVHRIGIIERGKLLLTGTVADVMKKFQETHVSDEGAYALANLEVELAEEREGLAETLSSFDSVRIVQQSTTKVAFVMRDDKMAIAGILNSLCQKYPVIAFSRRDLTLEEVFLKATKGHVQ